MHSLRKSMTLRKKVRCFFPVFRPRLADFAFFGHDMHFPTEHAQTLSRLGLDKDATIEQA